MSPNTFYCWLQDQPWSWIGLRRFQPKQDQSYPIWIPTIHLGLIAAGLILSSWLIGTIGIGLFLSGFTLLVCLTMHSLFSCLAWNQRAARIRRNDPASAVPPLAPRLALGFVYLLAVDVATPLAVVVVTENIRGSIAWRGTHGALAAKGERLAFADLVPAPVPDNQNFASIPAFARLFEYSRSGRGPTVWKDTNAISSNLELAWPDQFLPKRKGGGRREVSLEDWATAFRLARSNAAANPHQRTGPVNTPLPAYPAAPDGASAARVVLTALSVGDETLREICEASARPYARFPVHWTEGYNALLPHLAKGKLVSQQLALRTRAHLAEGERDAAFRDAQCGLRIGKIFKEEPLLISQLVHIAQMSLASDAIASGFPGHQWTESQLAEFQRAFEGSAHRTQMARAMEGERAGAILVMNQLADGWFLANATAWDDIVGQNGDELSAFLPFFPRGWIRQNQARLVEHQQTMIEQVRAMATNPPANGLVAPLRQYAAVPVSVATEPVTPYNVVYRLLVPALDKALSRAIRGDQTAILVAAGCAIERFRVARGKYPDSLDELIPTFLARPPLDLMTGQRIRYEQSNDRFRVWSVGRDGVDDDGTASVTAPTEDERGNDWVWPPQP